MKITIATVEAARQAEVEFYVKRPILAAQVTPEPVIREMLEAAFAHIPDEVAATSSRRRSYGRGSPGRGADYGRTADGAGLCRSSYGARRVPGTIVRSLATS